MVNPDTADEIYEHVSKCELFNIVCVAVEWILMVDHQQICSNWTKQTHVSQCQCNRRLLVSLHKVMFDCQPVLIGARSLQALNSSTKPLNRWFQNVLCRAHQLNREFQVFSVMMNFIFTKFQNKWYMLMQCNDKICSIEREVNHTVYSSG
jgi:hypothetical protein